MYKVTVLYEHPTDPDAFEKHFKEHHLPLAQAMARMSRIEITRFETSADGGKPAYYRMAEIFFTSKQVMEETMGSPEGQATINDLHNLTTTGVKILLGNVE
ncbi:EthD family reductase [Segetibacter aerophilus]|uniref:Ethyl tert-butyl ether degradation protein EthD n=1 Tax=Segetibacter aerophilus TaxID=670293 RepID=A0A512BK42_9BACT|nr:EthD family reductase [Segetibacter aerophilus]GEO12187.1 ethyl tert-butyl ether degradation protein EthD [Segetibacter aerophilus]